MSYLRETVQDLYDWISIHAQTVLFSTMICLLLLGFAREYTITQEIQKQQATACALRMAGRANTNEHERVPLRAALNYLGDLGSKTTTKDPKLRAAAIAFGVRFHGYAAAVQPLPNPEC